MDNECINKLFKFDEENVDEIIDIIENNHEIIEELDYDKKEELFLGYNNEYIFQKLAQFLVDKEIKIYKGALINKLLLDKEIEINKEISMNKLKFLLDNNFILDIQYLDVNKYSLFYIKFVAYMFYRDENFELNRELLYNQEIYKLTLEEVKDFVNFMRNITFNDDKLNKLISYILCVFQISEESFEELNSLIINSSIKHFNYVFTDNNQDLRDVYPLTTQTNIKILVKMFSYGYKYERKIDCMTLFNGKSDIIKFHMTNLILQKINPFIIIPILTPANMLKLIDTMKTYINIPIDERYSIFYMFLLKYLEVIRRIISSEIEGVSIEAKLNEIDVKFLDCLFILNIYPSEGEMQELINEFEGYIESIKQSYVGECKEIGEEIIEDIQKFIDVFHEFKLKEVEDVKFNEVKSKLFNENLSVRQYRKLRNKIKDVNFNYKGLTLPTFHYKNYKLVKKIMHDINKKDEFLCKNNEGKSHPLEMLTIEDDVETFKKYRKIKCNYNDHYSIIQRVIARNIKDYDFIMKYCNGNLIHLFDKNFRDIHIDLLKEYIKQFSNNKFYVLDEERIGYILSQNKGREDVYELMKDLK